MRVRKWSAGIGNVLYCALVLLGVVVSKRSAPPGSAANFNPGPHYTPPMLFAVLFTDKPGHGALRAEHLKAHIDWVAEHQDTVLVAGSLRTEPGAVPKGGLWVVEAPSREAVLAEVSEAAVAPHIRHGLYHLGFDAECAVGVFRLQLQDLAFWPEIPDGTSAYLHKLAVHPEKQGRGFAHQLLSHAVRLTREKRLRFLRLDCAAGRPKLRGVYESFGFRHHSQKQIGGGMFDRFEFDAGAVRP